jgi:hypothetical protein
MTRGGGHSDTAVRGSLLSAVLSRYTLICITIVPQLARSAGEKLGRLKPNNPLSNIGATLSVKVLKCLYSIPDGVSGIFHFHNPSGRTMALGLTQQLTEISTRNTSWGVRAAGA